MMSPGESASSIPGFRKYPTNRDLLVKSPLRWLEGKRQDDALDGLWRIHDKLYDLSKFHHLHPGGPDWITNSKGTDITELFESCHLSTLPKKILEKYYVRDAKEPRNVPYTFRPSGFYKTLQKKARIVLNEVGTGSSPEILAIMDGLGALFFGLLLCSYACGSVYLSMLTGVVLCMTGTCSHNFVHQRDTWRIYMLNLSMLSSFELRIFHSLSHHVYTNTVNDYEAFISEPFLIRTVNANKGWLRRYATWLYGHLLYPFYMPAEFLKRLYFIFCLEQPFRWEHTLPVWELVIGVIVTLSWIEAFKVWFVVHCSCSYMFAMVGVVASHHHPNIFHEGDTPRSELDWGLCQLDAIRDRSEVTGNLFLEVVLFGNHTLHHLFPTVDVSKLSHLYGVLEETCKEFDVPWRLYTFWDMLIGFHKQLARITPNPLPPWEIERREEKSQQSSSYGFQYLSKALSILTTTVSAVCCNENQPG